MSLSSEQNATDVGQIGAAGPAPQPPQGSEASAAPAAPSPAVAATKPKRKGIARFRSSGYSIPVLLLVLAGGFLIYHLATSHGVAVADLRVGDCFDAPAGGDTPSGTSGITGVQPIACTQAHDSQVFAKVKILESSFPGLDAIQSEAQADCQDVTRQSAVSSQAPVGLGAFSLFPQDADSFASEDYILCAIQFPSQTLTQSYVGTSGSGS